MTIITRKRKDQFAIIPNAVASDKRLTFEERGLLVYLLAKPNDWNVNVRNLQAEGGVGRDKVYRILGKLQEVGYVQRNHVQDDKGRFVGYDYIVHDDAVPEQLPLVPEACPSPENQEMESPSPENPGSGKPVTGFQDTYKEPIKQNTPQPPLQGGSGLFERLVSEWPSEKVGDKPKAYRAFEALTLEEQNRATDCAKTFLFAMRARKSKIHRLVTYLQDRMFDEFFAAPELDKDGLFKITPGRPEWSGWLGDIRKRHGERGVEITVRHKLYLTKTRWPEGVSA